MPWSGAPRRVATIAVPPRPNFAVRASVGALLASRVLQDESDLVLLELGG